MLNTNLKDLDYLDPLEINDYDPASKVLGGDELIKVYEPFKVGNSWILAFVSGDEDSGCVGSIEVVVNPAGEFIFKGIEKELYCTGSV